MAIDEFLLLDFLERGVSSFRLYGWKPPALSIGVHQKIDSVNLDLCESVGMPVVRRITGGSAILHGSDLCYSLVLSRELFGKGATIRDSFEATGAALFGFYERFGLRARYAKDVYPSGAPCVRSALCFDAAEEYDVMIDGRKIGGNAQARRRNAVFQHGSVPLEPLDARAFIVNDNGGQCVIESTSLAQLCDRPVTAEEAADAFTVAFASVFGADLVNEELTMNEKRRIVDITRRKYSDRNWNHNGRL